MAVVYALSHDTRYHAPPPASATAVITAISAARAFAGSGASGSDASAAAGGAMIVGAAPAASADGGAAAVDDGMGVELVCSLKLDAFVYAVALSANGTRLAIGTVDNLVQVRSARALIHPKLHG